MYVNSLFRILLSCVLAVVLTACGGGGGGGGGTILDPDPDAGGGQNPDGSTGSGSISLSISGLGDDNVLAGNEFATLTADVVENGSAANVIVLFETSIGRLVTDSAQSTGGTASVDITGDGTAGAATVTARATLSGGLEVEDSIVVQMSSDAPTLRLVDLATGEDAGNVELRAAETSNLVARVEDWDGTPLESVGVNFEFLFDNQESMTASINSGATDASGDLAVTLTGTQQSGTGTFQASANFSGFELEDTISINGLGVNTDLNNITLDTIDVGTDGVLAGNEKTMIVARVTEDGALRNGIVVQFTASGGTLVNSSANSANDGSSDGVAMVQFIGDAMPGTATITASATLSNGIDVVAEQTVQTSADGPILSLEARDTAGNVITTFGANQNLTLEATLTNFDGSALDADDAGVNVTFDVGGLGTTVNASDVTEFAACPVNGIKANADCAFVQFTSNSTAAVGQFTASATLNNIALMDDLQVTNTGINSGAGDQDSFSISRITNNNETVAIDDTFGVEGDQFNDQTAFVEVDLADFFNNPVPDGTLIEFRTELGDIEQSCETVDGGCRVTFTSADPRTPIDAEVSFRNLVDDKCPSKLIVNETTSVSSGRALTDFRVDSISRVLRTGTTTVLTPGTDYNPIADGIECVSGSCTGSLDITYERLWLDEVDDGSTAHIIAEPGEATEPFLDRTGIPCLAPSRDRLELITGSINPNGTTSVVGVGTLFELELAIGDRLKVQDEIRTITAIATNTSLTVDAAFSDGVNDVTPQRIAAPAYLGGMGQPYGARSTILAFAIGEESFIDTNGNDEYDYGERFDDLTEVFMDKNEDGVLGDFEGESASATAIGPYSDGGSGGDPVGGKRDKSDPFCYGPKTIVGDPAGPLSSTEADTYCYQDGGEEEFFIDNDGDNEMDLGNGIYNGSRCLRPMQDADGDGNEDDVVCTTDLVNISRDVQILMGGSTAFVSFRALDGTGGANGGGEVISFVERRGGNPIANTIADPADWTTEDTTAVIEVSTQKGADVDTGLLVGGSRDVELVTIPNAITDPTAVWTLSFSVDRTDGGADSGDVEVFAAGQALTFDGGTCGEVTETCTVTGFTVAGTGNLIVASADDTDPLAAEINNFVLTGVTTGLSADYRIVSGDFDANDGTSLTDDDEFDTGLTVDASTVVGGVSEVFDDFGNLPTLSTSIQIINAWHVDRYNGQLPDGTTVEVQSDNSSGCTISSVNGIVVNSNDPGPDSGSSHSETVTVGSSTGRVTSIVLTTGFGSGPVNVTVTTPSGTLSGGSFTCEL